MPPSRTAKKVTPKEQRIAKAIQEIRDGTLKNATIASKHHRVPYYKLVRRLNGQSAVENNSGHNKALSTIQEKALLLYIDRCKELGRPCKQKHIEMAANSLLFASSSLQTVSRS